MGWTFSLLPRSFSVIIAPTGRSLRLRPQAANRAARWFLANFPGRVLYAAKANDAAPIMDALVQAGINAFDVASLVEIERMAAFPGAELYFMNPVKSRVGDQTRLSRVRDQKLRLRQRGRARQDPRGDREGEGPHPLSPAGLPQYAQPHPARRQVRNVERRGAGVAAARAPGRAAPRHHLPCRVPGGGAGGLWRGPAAGRPIDRGLRRAGRCHRHRRRVPKPLSAFRSARPRRLIPMRSSRRGTSSPSGIPASFFASPDGRWWRRRSPSSCGSTRAGTMRFMSMTAPSARCSTRPIWASAIRRG